MAVSPRAHPAAARMKVSTRERVNRGDTAATDRRGTVAPDRVQNWYRPVKQLALTLGAD